jgi:hypothetical protein
MQVCVCVGAFVVQACMLARATLKLGVALHRSTSDAPACLLGAAAEEDSARCAALWRLCWILSARDRSTSRAQCMHVLHTQAATTGTCMRGTLADVVHFVNMQMLIYNSCICCVRRQSHGALAWGHSGGDAAIIST